MNRKSLIASLLGATFIFASVLATPAAAYPPGTDLNLSVADDVINWDSSSTTVFPLVTNGGSKVVVWINGKKRTTLNTEGGAVLFPFTAGKYGRSIITTVSGSQKKTIYVYRPTKPVIYSTQKISKAFLVKTKGAKPGTPYIVLVNGQPAGGMREINNGGFGTFYVPKNKLRKGENTVTFLLGGLEVSKTVNGFK